MRWWIHMTDEHINVGDLREARVKKEHERRKWKRYTQEILSKSNLLPSPYSKLSKVILQYSPMLYSTVFSPSPQRISRASSPHGP